MAGGSLAERHDAHQHSAAWGGCGHEPSWTNPRVGSDFSARAPSGTSSAPAGQFSDVLCRPSLLGTTTKSGLSTLRRVKRRPLTSSSPGRLKLMADVRNHTISYCRW